MVLLCTTDGVVVYGTTDCVVLCTTDGVVVYY